MNEVQAERAMRILAELYANQMGIENPKIFIKKKENEKWRNLLLQSIMQARILSMLWLKLVC